MPGSKNTNYILDIMPEDRLFTDAHPDDLIIVSVFQFFFILHFSCSSSVMGMTGAGKSTVRLLLDILKLSFSNRPVVHQ
jgi:hypothetical protein